MLLIQTRMTKSIEVKVRNIDVGYFYLVSSKYPKKRDVKIQKAKINKSYNQTNIVFDLETIYSKKNQKGSASLSQWLFYREKKICSQSSDLFHVCNQTKYIILLIE